MTPGADAIALTPERISATPQEACGVTSSRLGKTTCRHHGLFIIYSIYAVPNEVLEDAADGPESRFGNVPREPFGNIIPRTKTPKL